MISVCIATYNGEKYIKEQIKSILDQLSDNDEIVISDDGSVDKTIEIINNFYDKRIKIVFNELERGYTNNFENAINIARGDFIFLSDQDDVWMNNKVLVTIRLLKQFDLVVSDALFVNENLEDLKCTFFSIRGGTNGFYMNLYKSQYLGACLAFKKEILVKLLPFPQKKELCPHDLWISLVSEFYFKTAVINMPLIKYRRHGNNVSTGGEASNNSLFKQIRFRLYCLTQILLRIRA
jgi:glycosyltransferase involved in cell wall biosynthesis